MMSPNEAISFLGFKRRVLELAQAYQRYPLNLYVAMGCSYSADGIAMVALPLLAVSVAVSPAELGYIASARSLPWLLLSVPAGYFIDRFRPPRAIILACLLRSLVGMTIALDVINHHVSITALAIFSFCLGSLEVVVDTGMQSIIPLVVSADQLTPATAYQQTMERVGTSFLGAPIAGFVSQWFKAGSFFAIVVLYAVAAVLIPLKLPRHPGDSALKVANNQKIDGGFYAGIMIVLQHRPLRFLALVTAFLNLALTATGSILVMFVTQGLQEPPSIYALLTTIAAAGAILGALIAGRLRSILGDAGCFRVALPVFSIGTCITPVGHHMVIVTACLFSLSVAGGLWGAIAVSYRQRIVPKSLLGRVNAFYRMLAWGSLPVGAFLGGWGATFFGYTALYEVCGCILALPLVALPFLSAEGLMESRGHLE